MSPTSYRTAPSCFAEHSAAALQCHEMTTPEPLHVGHGSDSELVSISICPVPWHRGHRSPLQPDTSRTGHLQGT